ncbi:MAG: hypothetical protein E7576_07020 [Ruminococcaceae bacterium]|nr:hypothetical protein [Oscillospiraceae bacterium]
MQLEEFGNFTATCQKVNEDRAEFIFDNCVADEIRDDVDSVLEKIAAGLRDSLKAKLLKVDIPTYGQIFGHDDFYERFEPDNDERWPLMKDRRNRIALDTDGNLNWYWLKNRCKNSAPAFAYVYYVGAAGSNHASGSGGVRPAFLLEL